MEPEKNPARPDAVYFFATCLLDNFYPEAGLAAIEWLEAAGIRVAFPQTQTCCGQPATNSGYPEQATRVALAQINQFDQPWPIIVPSASCAGFMLHQWPRLLAGRYDSDQLTALLERVVEFGVFVAEQGLLAETPISTEETVALHTSCAGQREVPVADVHEALVDKASGGRRVRFQRSEECCGFGGTFAVKQPALSAAMVEDKANAIVASGADVLVSGDCGCLMNIQGYLEKQKAPIRCEHLLSYLARRRLN